MSDCQREALRQKALAEIELLDTAPEREFDALVRSAQRLLSTGMSSMSLVNDDRLWFKARCGLDYPAIPRNQTFCTTVFEAEEALVVPDATLDPRFADAPFVTGYPYVRYYAGVPIRLSHSDGSQVTIGTLCVLDRSPREPVAAELDALSELACVAEALVDARAAAVRATRAAEDHRIANELLERERRLLKQAERMAEIGSWRYDLASKKTSWSDGVFAIHELPVSGGVPNDEILAFFAEPDRHTFIEQVKVTLATGAPLQIDAELTTAKGNRRRVRCSCEVELSKGRPVALIGMLQDVTARHELESRLLRLARTDDLTQLSNRAEFNRVLDARLGDLRNDGGEFAVLLIDLDGFKEINDALGHASGDEILRKVADQLRKTCREGWFPARLGGDEFAVVVPTCTSAADLAPQVDRLLRNLDIVISEGGRIGRVTASVGIAWSREAGEDRATLLHQADAALYAAKRSLKGTARTYGKVRTGKRAG
ncbi:sensor domain-containing diguanylate cyclase [Fulvimarina endophytica]|uniref:Sensor domain-containing diguanylate cyclase n=1 Tax=Fulvimarina endophytica TaxID=2293836 RepID=A0A371X370_9HYPH|nr:sensor domain-containing diguanylate cyclase [Fulvimarina endophytica]RFC63681.1 sensor domain-containing diguanylate cyclase [Fulvimarina endophytica]